MQKQLNDVREFMRQLCIPVNKPMGMTSSGTRELAIIGMALNRCAMRLGNLAESDASGDLRVQRAQLITEETAELVTAMMTGDEVMCCDAIADLLYVVLGTALTFDWPLIELFDAVHRSNMTKRLHVESDNLRHDVKGAEYVPPDIEGVLQTHREKLMEQEVSSIIDEPVDDREPHVEDAIEEAREDLDDTLPELSDDE